VDQATLDQRLREEPWLLRNADTLFEAFPFPDGTHGCKLCGEKVPAVNRKLHHGRHIRRLETLRRKTEAQRKQQAITNLQKGKA
jgi:hypothetical protein